VDDDEEKKKQLEEQRAAQAQAMQEAAQPLAATQMPDQSTSAQDQETPPRLDATQTQEEEGQVRSGESVQQAFQRTEDARRQEEQRQLVVARDEEEEAAKKAQEEENAANRGTTRRNGLPTTLVLNRQGDLFVAVPQRHTRRIAKLFEVRLELCSKAKISDHGVLSIASQKEGQDQLRQIWMNSLQGKKSLREVIWFLCSHLMVTSCQWWGPPLPPGGNGEAYHCHQVAMAMPTIATRWQWWASPLPLGGNGVG
jgi:hypothetical protein